MIDKEAVTGALDAISDAINAQLNALDGNDRGTVLANLTISLVRACEQVLDEDSFNHLCDLLEGGFNNEENCAEVVH